MSSSQNEDKKADKTGDVNEMEESKKQTIELQLSDVIRIEAPSNLILNNNLFIIEYIDKHTIR